MAAAPAALSPRQQAEDFDALWRAVDEGYAYFDARRGAWRQARATWRPRAARATSRADFVAALQAAVDELRDDHVTLSERAGQARRVPFETDIRPRWIDGAAVIEAVRTFGDADVAGLRAGLVVTRVRDVPVERAVRERLGAASAGVAARDWALRQILAGPRQGTQRIEVRDAGRTGVREIERTDAPHAEGVAVIGRRMGEERDIGYIRVRIGAHDPRLVERFDAALNYLKDTRALILDLRENAGPGARAATLAILGRFAAAPSPWQVREPRGKAREIDIVAPRLPTYAAPVVILVDHWTAGEGEALAAGMHAVAGAKLIGTAMAGLRGEVRETTLAHSGIVLRFPAQRTFQVNGEPREALRPAIPVDLAAPSGGPGDPILYQALKALAR